MLTSRQVEKFIQEGFIRIDEAFPRSIAARVVDRLWDDLPCDRRRPETWTHPVIRLGMYAEPPFIESVNGPELLAAFDQLLGDQWLACRNVGTFPVRFPNTVAPGDTGRHVDASFPGADPSDYFQWRVNIRSRGRGLLMLVLYSDTGVADAPTIIHRRSHLDVARLLRDQGENGMSFIELARAVEQWPAGDSIPATGPAGTIYLCHPFVVHSAQAHTGTNPRFMAQPPLLIRNELSVEGKDKYTPVEQAIRLGMGVA